MELQDYPTDFDSLSEREKLVINHMVFEGTLRHRVAITGELESLLEQLNYQRATLWTLQSDINDYLQGLSQAMIRTH